ncbi:glycolipid transfer protein, putative [Plasmodium gallinaceum]|uniref:Glycolipid transfer protein, putative n=1 Tax=Plasmodium gallinaceum TaxID=5849 RepID=A0A1J1GW92_PLAGA|nr:glycolipid transfer protein, putative [Plasmodium gallinaceum]CRG96707.1 glycolipid transfer protein, putative [Plasmodium gallinaceum]
MTNILEGKIFLKEIEKKSLECREKDEILVLKLCELSNAIYPIYNKIFGDGFLGETLKKDLKNSSLKVKKAVEKVPEETKYVSKMYSYNLKKYENLEKLKKDMDNGLINFMWMKRALEFIVVFLEKCYVTKSSSKLNICAQEAYEEVLKSYHGYITVNLVKLGIKLSPSRENLTKRLGFESNEEAKIVIQNFILITKPLINDISKIMEKYNCNFKDKV